MLNTDTFYFYVLQRLKNVNLSRHIIYKVKIFHIFGSSYYESILCNKEILTLNNPNKKLVLRFPRTQMQLYGSHQKTITLYQKCDLGCNLNV